MVPTRIRWLIAVHLVLMAAPLAMLTFAAAIDLLPLMWLIASLPIGSLMTIAIWLGLGPQRLVTRLLVGVLAVVYAMSWQVITQIVEHSRANLTYEWGAQMLYEGALLYLVLLLVIGGVFAVSKRWWVVGHRIDGPSVEDKRSLRFSLLGLIALTTLIAIVVTLSRATRSSINSDSAGFMAASFGLFLIAFLANTYFAVHAILRPGRFASSLLLVMLLSSLLGVALSLAMGQDELGVLMVLAGAVISVAPTLVVVGSLLVVRSCGIRLVRKSLRPTDGELGAIITSPFRL